MKVLFINENTLGHASYLGRFANYFQTHPELGIQPELLNATPLTPSLAKKANRSIPLLRKFGLDLHFVRWRKIVSAHVRKLVDAKSFDTILVNTQSIALDLIAIKKPLFVALDATFTQLSRGPWFCNVGPKRIRELINRENELFNAASAILPWSQIAADSLLSEYHIDRQRIHLLPPSLEIPQKNIPPKPTQTALFIGGDFQRKGGEILLSVFRKRFRDRLKLKIVTNSEIPNEEGVEVFHGLGADTAQWAALWREADFLVFPSKLETFGIVLVEALAFGLPVIASRAGAAEEILLAGKAGLLLDDLSEPSITAAIVTLLANPAAARERAEIGRQHAEAKYNLGPNSAALAELLRGKS